MSVSRCGRCGKESSLLTARMFEPPMCEECSKRDFERAFSSAPKFKLTAPTSMSELHERVRRLERLLERYRDRTVGKVVREVLASNLSHMRDVDHEWQVGEYVELIARDLVDALKKAEIV